jgi:hypothetical protein
LSVSGFAPGAGSFHTHRLDERREILGQVFSSAAMERVWKKYIRPGLRDQEVLDLYDYNDFHWDRKTLFKNLHAEVMSGRYRPQRSIPVRVEKRNGVVRTLFIPTPNDSVILQCIVEYILPKAIAKQPSPNAFFSRSHGFSAPKFTFTRDYIWFRRWGVFSRLRFRIASTHTYICTTDIANYFDNISYEHLRNMLSAIDGIDEVTMDILFLVLDEIGWRPDYLPAPGRSLPQVNFDAPRLLSHVYLYEIDEFLKKRSNNAFVRWVDDITVAADSVDDAKGILRDLDQLLMTRGLRLNAGKTQVLSALAARKFFQETENEFLDLETKRLPLARLSQRRLNLLRIRVAKRFDVFVAKSSHGHSDKIIKRYINLFGLLGDAHAVRYCLREFAGEPGLRDSIWRYLSSLGPSRHVFRALSAYLAGPMALDDSSLFHIAKLLTEWEVKPGTALHRDLRLLGQELGRPELVAKSAFYLVASTWILSKYGLKKHLGDMLAKHSELWRTSEFLSRQVAASLPKFRGDKQGRTIRGVLEQHRFPSVIAVLSSLDRLVTETGTVNTDVRLYILNGRQKSTYSVQRFLQALSVLTSNRATKAFKMDLKKDVVKYISDPLYLKVLEKLKV